MKYPNARLIILSKAPKAYQVKTRLLNKLPVHETVHLHEKLLSYTVEQACQTDLCSVSLYCAGDLQHPFIQQLTQKYRITLEQQVDGTLGERLTHAIKQSMQQAERIIVIGSDCPVLSPIYIEQALQALNEYPIVLGPAEDGGYVLLGMRQFIPELFQEIPWSTESVYAESCQRLQQQDIHYHELTMLWDVDTYADYQRLQRECPALA